MMIHKTLHQRDDTDSMCQEEKKEEDSQTFCFARMQRVKEQGKN